MSKISSKGTVLSRLIYKFKEWLIYPSMLIPSILIPAIILSFLVIYFGESFFIDHHLFSYYINNFFSGAKLVDFEGEQVDRLYLISVAAKHIEAAHIWQIFFGLVALFSSALFIPVKKFIDWRAKIMEEGDKDKWIRGSKIIEGEDYADMQIEAGENHGIMLSPVFEFIEEYEEIKEGENNRNKIIQYKGKEVVRHV